jgi:DNA polymerase-3 subunit gamma/tau
MGQALYRKYRSKSLEEVVGQEHITDTLKHALKTGKLAHAYLFTGPRGVGKTSIARILAHEINGIAYEDDSTHLDIIEIDAASNRRIDEIRDLRDKVNIAPSSAKYKVYIIDEVHMLTREAFNALLKTLEEPPAHAVFILATTESHKLPETIVSRTQRFIFKPVSQAKVVAHLRSIADTEKIEISDEALALVAAHGEGSFRDSISLLDQTRGHDGAVDADYVRSLIGLPTDEAIQDLSQALQSANASSLVQTLEGLRTKGFAAPQVAKHLARHLRQEILAGKGQAGIFELLGKLLEVPTAHNPESYLELTLLSHALNASLPAATVQPQQIAVAAASVQSHTATAVQPLTRPTVNPTPASSAATAASPSPAAATSTKPTAIAPPVPTPTAQPPAEIVAEPTPEPISQPADTVPQQLAEPIDVDENLWPQVLNSLKKSYNTLYGIARMSRPTFYENSLELAFTFAFHKRRISEDKNKEIIINIIKQLTGKEYMVTCILLSKDEDIVPVAAASGPASLDVAAISNIFGDAEVLGS